MANVFELLAHFCNALTFSSYPVHLRHQSWSLPLSVGAMTLPSHLVYSIDLKHPKPRLSTLPGINWTINRLSSNSSTSTVPTHHSHPTSQPPPITPLRPTRPLLGEFPCNETSKVTTLQAKHLMHNHPNPTWKSSSFLGPKMEVVVSPSHPDNFLSFSQPVTKWNLL